jgi:hypothetical protein
MRQLLGYWSLYLSLQVNFLKTTFCFAFYESYLSTLRALLCNVVIVALLFLYCGNPPQTLRYIVGTYTTVLCRTFLPPSSQSYTSGRP